MSRPLYQPALPIHHDPNWGDPSFQAYLYYCASCREGLIITEKHKKPNMIITVFNHRCPRCYGNLERTLKEELIDVPEEIMFLTNPNYRRCFEKPPLESPHFITALQYLRSQHGNGNNLLTFGDTMLDEALQGLVLGQFIVFHGSVKCHRLSELLCVRAQLSPEMGGLNSHVLFLDGGNCFDPYLISDYARQKNLDPDQILEKIHISRAFTYPQLTTLITRKLPESINKYKAKLVVISDITNLYKDRHVTAHDKVRMFNKVLLFLSIHAQKQGIIIIATHLSSSRDERALELKLFHHAQILVQIKNEPIETLTLEKHPYLEPRTVNLSNKTEVYPLTPFF